MTRLGHLGRAATLPVRHRLITWVVVAALLGLVLPGGALLLRPLVPLFLAGQVLGVALNLTPAAIREALRRSRVIGIALLAQWTIVPCLGLLLRLWAPTPTLATGILISAVAPAEITSGLMTALAGGDAAIATVCMASSLALSIVLTPLWLELARGSSTGVNQAALVEELALSVLLPLLIGVAVRARWPEVRRFGTAFLDLSAVCLLLVVLAGTSSARGVLLSSAIVPAFLLALGLLLGSGSAGWALGRVLRLGRSEALAVGFPVGIREFGVAIAVAEVIDPSAAAVGGVYGLVMVGTVGVLASRLGRRARAAP